jgi:hypothetical protein
MREPLLCLRSTLGDYRGEREGRPQSEVARALGLSRTVVASELNASPSNRHVRLAKMADPARAYRR